MRNTCINLFLTYANQLVYVSLRSKIADPVLFTQWEPQQRMASRLMRLWFYLFISNGGTLMISFSINLQSQNNRLLLNKKIKQKT